MLILEAFHMVSKIKEIEEEALRLPSHERARLAEHLINSLDEKEDPEAEKLWIEEAERRYREYKEGKVKAKQSDLVLKEARSKLS
jgi:putative addiction module component (TIGR02574 family)